MRLEVTTNIRDVIVRLNAAGKDSSKAVAVALTRSASAAKDAVKAAMPSAFDRPTPYTLNSVRLRPATRERLTALVEIKDDAVKWLIPEIQGGQRNLKRFEKALIARRLMPDGMMAVPASGAALDAYGNVSRGVIMKMLSALQAAEMTLGYSANRTVRSSKKSQAQYFCLLQPHGRLKPGIYQRFGFAKGSAVRPIFIYVQRPTYRRRLDFFGIADQVATQRFPQELTRALREFAPKVF